MLSAPVTIIGGLVGIPEAANFTLLLGAPEDPFALLRCNDAEAAWVELVVATDPFALAPGYEFDLPDHLVDQLGLSAPADALTLCTVSTAVQPTESDTADADVAGQRTVRLNLAGPIVVNRATGNAVQYVVPNSSAFQVRVDIASGAAAGNGRDD